MKRWNLGVAAFVSFLCYDGNSARAGLGDGLVAFYTFNGDANDYSGKTNNGTVHNATFDNDGINGTKSLRFNGSGSSYVIVPRSSSLEPPDAMTIAFWCKGFSGPSYGTIIRKANADQSGFLIRKQNCLLSDSPLTFLYSYYPYNPYFQYDYYSAFSNFNGTNWTHLAVTCSFTAGVIRTYVNGTQVDSTNLAFHLYHTGALYIGGAAVDNGVDADGGFNGLLDEVRIYNRALSSSEVLQLYNGGNSVPVIIAQPQSLTTNAGGTASFSVAATGTGQLFYRWRKNNANMSGKTNTTLTLNSVQASDSASYSVLVSNSVGYVVSASASLAVLGSATSNTPATQINDTDPLVRQPGKSNLVFVTHGAQPGWTLPSPAAWVSNMCAAISNRVPSDWQVVPYFWTSASWIPGIEIWKLETQVMPQEAILGTQKGQQISTQGWQSIHFVAHSAGSLLINTAIGIIHSNSPSTTIQATFLDPYVDLNLSGQTNYGMRASWADCYYTYNDLETGHYTDGGLEYAHNVEVSWLDPKDTTNSFMTGIPGLGVTTNYLTAQSSHGWPVDFYMDSITNPSRVSCAGNYGFPLSMESGGWGNHGGYSENTSVTLCGLPPIVQTPPPLNFNSFLQLFQLPSASSGANVTFAGGSCTLGNIGLQSVSPSGVSTLSVNPVPLSASNAPPTWVAMAVAVTNPANFLSFDASFAAATGGQGLLTVYWNTNQIGMVDQRVALSGLQTYQFVLPATYTDGMYTLGFQLDTFTNVASSVTITNVMTGFSGVSTPISMKTFVSGSNNMPVIQLTGASNFNYIINTSTDLVSWTPTALLVNTNGTVLFADPDRTNFSRRFYNGVLQ